MALRQKFRIRNNRNISPIFLCKPCKCLRVTLDRKLNKCRRVVCIYRDSIYIESCLVIYIFISTQFENRSFIPFPGNYFYLQKINKQNLKAQDICFYRDTNMDLFCVCYRTYSSCAEIGKILVD